MRNLEEGRWPVRPRMMEGLTTRKHALGPPQKYPYEDEDLRTGTFRVDGTYKRALGTGWCYHPVPKPRHYQPVPKALHGLL